MMETPQKRQKSWFSSLTGLVSGSRPSSTEGANGIATSAKKADAYSAKVKTSHTRPSKSARISTPSRFSGTFSAPPVESPESPASPAKRASPTLLAQRKIHGRAQGPSGKVSMASTSTGHAENSYNGNLGHYNNSLTPRRTNFSSATTPKNMFRDSIAREMPAFSFTPRVPPNTLRGSFPAPTPGRSFRSSGIELSGREMAKTSSSELFAMKIPDPDPKLSGEAVASMVPKDVRVGNRSVYANEYLAHLCPPDFSEEQRNQFFCILDLRRLKYAADEVFMKKDWRLNILNFAKEYEKNRSLIMLRYGLYEFKTVKVSKDVFNKWKTDNNIPDLDEDADVNNAQDSTDGTKSAPAPKASRTNGTEGILRSEKRKADDDITSSSAVSSGNKRSRPLEGSDREPLTETSTPTLNKSKRKATSQISSEDVRSKQQKSTGMPAPAAPSATRALFEKISNSPGKPAADGPSSSVPKPSTGESPLPKSSLLKGGGPSFKPASNSLARSVLESGLKASAAQNNNIFGYLSDASSAKGSGNDNADADGEDTDDSDGHEESASLETNGKQSPPVAPPADDSSKTSEPKPAFSLFSFAPKEGATPTASAPFGSSASPDASELASGRSLFDRVNKTSDGQPIRMVGAEGAGMSLGSSAFGKSAAGEKSADKESAAVASPAASSLFGGNKTWTPDSPIKFAAAAASNTPQAAKPLFGAPSTGDSAPATGSPSASIGLFSAPAAVSKDTTAVPAPAASLFGAAKDASTSSAVTAPAPAMAFGDLSKNATPASTSTTAEAKPAPAPLFGSAIASAAPSATASTAATPAPAAPSLFGTKPAGSIASTTPLSAPTTAPSIFGAAKVPAPASVASSASTPSLFGMAASSSQPATNPALQSQTLFGTPKADSTLASPARKRGMDDDADPSASALFGSPMKVTNDSDEQPQAKKLFGGSQAATASALFSFGAKPNGAADLSKPAQEPSKPLFGLGAPTSVAEPPKSLFGNTPTPTTGPSTSSIFSFGNNASTTTSIATSQPSASFSFGAAPQTSSAGPAAAAPGALFGGNTVSAPSSFTFSVGGGGGESSGSTFRNPFAGNDTSSFQATPSLSFGAQPSASASSPFQFGGGVSSTPAAPAAAGNTGSAVFSFGAASQPSSQATSAMTSGSTNGASSMFSFGAGSSTQTSSTLMFGQQPSATGAANGPIFNLAPPVGGTSTGTNTPFTNPGGASSLATTPASGTPEPAGIQEKDKDSAGQNEAPADGEEAPQEQISLTSGGPGEEDEAIVYEVRAKAMRLASAKEEEEGGGSAKDKKSPWKTEGVGPFRVLKHKTTGAVRLLLRGEPRGHVALNRALLPDFGYKPEPNAKYVKLTTANETGSGLETWMLQVKTKEAAQELAEALENNKSANKK